MKTQCKTFTYNTADGQVVTRRFVGIGRPYSPLKVFDFATPLCARVTGYRTKKRENRFRTSNNRQRLFDDDNTARAHVQYIKYTQYVYVPRVRHGVYGYEILARLPTVAVRSRLFYNTKRS